MKKENIKTLEQLKKELKEQMEGSLDTVVYNLCRGENVIEENLINSLLEDYCEALDEFRELHLDDKFTDEESHEFYEFYDNIVCNFMEAEGYEFYLERDKYYYRKLPTKEELAKDGFDELDSELNYLDVDYIVDYKYDYLAAAPIYVKNEEGKVLAIASEETEEYLKDYDYKKIYSLDDYINYDTILKDIKKFIKY